MKNAQKVAIEYGESLKSFSTQEEAEQYFYNFLKQRRQQLVDITKDKNEFLPDYTVKSLERLENWYLKLAYNDEFDKVGIERLSFEEILTVYFGDVVIKNKPDVKWGVNSYPFSINKYYLGLQKGYGIYVINFSDHFQKIGEKKATRLTDKYTEMFKE